MDSQVLWDHGKGETGMRLPGSEEQSAKNINRKI